MSDENHTNRMLNTPITLSVKGMGDVHFKEPSFETVLNVIGNSTGILSALVQVEDVTNPVVIFEYVLKNPGTYDLLKQMFAACTDQEIEKFNNIPPVAALQLIKGVLQVIDLEEMKELFFQIWQLAGVASEQ